MIYFTWDCHNKNNILYSNIIRYYLVRYEDLCDKPYEVIGKIFNFLGFERVPSEILK